MPTIRVTLLVEIDDAPVASFPLIRRQTPAKMEPLATTRVTSATFTALPSTEMTTIQQLILQADQATALRLTPSDIPLNANAIVCIFDAGLTAASLQNNSGSTANVKGLLAGS